jgi:hypothetical protein
MKYVFIEKINKEFISLQKFTRVTMSIDGSYFVNNKQGIYLLIDKNPHMGVGLISTIFSFKNEKEIIRAIRSDEINIPIIQTYLSKFGDFHSDELFEYIFVFNTIFFMLPFFNENENKIVDRVFEQRNKIRIELMNMIRKHNYFKNLYDRMIDKKIHVEIHDFISKEDIKIKEEYKDELF